MSTGVRTALILLATLVLGMALGGVASATVRQQRQERVGELRRPHGFVDHMLDVIEPRDAAQRAQILPIIESVGRRNDAIIRDANDRLRSGVDSMHAVLAPLLDADQRRRLEETKLPDPFRRGPPPPPRR
jgi:hypothetical protein